MRTLPIIAILLTLAFASVAHAAVEVTYDFNVDTVDIEAHDCLDSSCNGVIGQSSLQFPDGKHTTNGRIRVVFPDSLATPHGYALYYVSDGYLPLEAKATWHTFGVGGTAHETVPITFTKKQTCAALIDNFAITNDVFANVPLVIRTQASLDATTHSALSLTNNGIAPVPPQFKDNHYSVDTLVDLTIYDQSGNTIQQFPALSFTQANGNPLFASESRDVEFTWIPMIPGTYNAQMRTQVVDNQCVTSVDQVSSKPEFTVLSAPPANRCDTMLNNLKVVGDLPVRSGDDVTLSYTRTSNHADGSGSLTPVSTNVQISVEDASGNALYSSSETLVANSDSGSSLHEFTYTAQEGVNKITLTGVSGDGMCSGIANSQEVITLDVPVESAALFDIEFIISDADSSNRVVGAEVRGPSTSVITDSDGVAVQTDLAPGSYDFEIIHPDFVRTTKTVQVTDYDRTIFVTLAPENRPPVIAGLPSVTITKDADQEPVLDLDDYVIDDDHADSALTWGGIASHNLLANVEPTTHVLDLTNLGGVGNGHVDLVVTDPSGATASARLLVTITDHNTAPTLADLPDHTLQEDEHRHDVLYLADFANDAETPSGDLQYTITQNTNPAIEVVIDSENRLDIKPKQDIFGSATVTIEVSDGQLTDADTFTITVEAVNDAPIILDVPNVVTNLDLVTVIDLSLLAIDVDDSTTALVWDAFADGVIGTLSLDRVNNLLTITPNQLGSMTVTLTLTDGSGATATNSFAYTVTDGSVIGHTQCSDGVDNDGDGLVDLADPGCTDSFDIDERDTNGTNPNPNPTTPACSDGIDNDGDGFTDYPADLGCANAADNDETDGVGRYRSLDQDVEVMIEQIRIPTAYELSPGSDVVAYIRFENTGDIDLENVKVTMAIDELGLRYSRGPNDLDEDEDGSETLFLNLPRYTIPGYYYVRFSIQNNDIKRTVFREILVH